MSENGGADTVFLRLFSIFSRVEKRGLRRAGEAVYHRKLFKEIASGRYEIYISEVVEREMEKAPREIRKRLAGVAGRYNPFVLEDDAESRELVYNYVENGLLSEGQLADLLHVAIGTINEMDIIVSWNLKHIVKMKTRTLVNEINHLCGYRGIEICAPKEVLEYGE